MLDLLFKFVSIIFNIRVQKLLSINRHPMHHSDAPIVGCAEAILTLKTMFKTRREFRVDTWALFEDLVKENDNIKHEVTALELKKYVYQIDA